MCTIRGISLMQMTINLATLQQQRAHWETHKLRGQKRAGREAGGARTTKLNVVTWKHGKNGSFGNLSLLRAQAAHGKGQRAFRLTRNDQNAHEETVKTKLRSESSSGDALHQQGFCTVHLEWEACRRRIC